MADLFDIVQEVRTTVYRKVPSTQMRTITTSKDVEELVRPGWFDLDHVESMKILFLNRSSKVIGMKIISTGGISSVLVDVRILFQAALGCNSTSVIMVHNHPSGSLIPSDADIAITRKVKNAGDILDIKLLDHMILSDTSYYSMADNGII